MRTWLFRLAAIALLCGLPPVLQTERAWACSCEMRDPLEALEYADVVFAGTVTVRGGIGSAARFRVSRVWKGEPYATRFVGPAMVDHGDGEVSVTSCDKSFRPGEEYLVYGYYDDEVEGLLLTSTCRVGSLAPAELELLGEGRAPEPGTTAPGPVEPRQATSPDREDEPPPPAPSDAGTGTLSEPKSPDGWAIALLAAAAVALAGLGFAAARRRARDG